MYRNFIFVMVATRRTCGFTTVPAVPAVTDFDFSQVRVVGGSPFKCTCVAAHAPALPALSSHAVIDRI